MKNTAKSLTIVLAITLASCIGKNDKTSEDRYQASTPAPSLFAETEVIPEAAAAQATGQAPQQAQAPDTLPDYWGIYTANLIEVEVMGSDGVLYANAPVALARGRAIISEARTDNKGIARLWLGLTHKNEVINYSGLHITVNGLFVTSTVIPFSEGVNRVTMPHGKETPSLEAAFVIDATGSMGSEAPYLKTQLADAVSRIAATRDSASLKTAALFYRDAGDEYVTTFSPFSADPATTCNFINTLTAEGGGDSPEALHTALDEALSGLQWNPATRTKLLFIALDAPSHHDPVAVRSLHASIKKAMSLGIRIIPVVSANDPSTEFLMRSISVATGGTFLSLTDNPTEPLSDSIVKIITRYDE